MSHLYATKRPMSSARRDYVNGPLHPMEQARIIARIGMGPALWLAAGALVPLFAIIAFSGA